MTVWVAAYPLLTFTSWLNPYDSTEKIRKEEAGWAIVGCLAFNVAFNFALLIISVLYSFYYKLKLIWIRHQNRLKNTKMLQARERKRSDYIKKRANERKERGQVEYNFIDSLFQSQHEEKKTKKEECSKLEISSFDDIEDIAQISSVPEENQPIRQTTDESPTKNNMLIAQRIDDLKQRLEAVSRPL